MATNEESREERFERQRRQLQEALMDHQRRMETDPEYRAECIAKTAWIKDLVTFGNDTEED